MRVLLFVLMLVIAGCTARRTAGEPPTMEVEAGIYDVSEGDRIALDDLWVRLDDARFVLVAESHDDPMDHDVQFTVLQALAERGEVALGMEMFQRPFQEPLDRFVAGEIDEATMLEETEWEKRWGFAVEMYSPMWTFAAQNDIPILALNARRELTKRISGVGLEGLTDAERADLPEIDLSGDRYRDWMRAIFRAHGATMDPARFEKFYQAQVTWDETMADTAVRWAREHPDATVMIVVGRGHVERDFGIPSRIRRRIGAEHGDGTVVSIVPLDDDEVPRFRWMRRERFANYVWAYGEPELLGDEK